VPSLLTLIWLSALFLIIFAFTALALLVAARFVRQRDQLADPDRHERVSKALLLHVAKNGPRPTFNIGNRVERMAVLETALDALPFLRPQAKERLESLLREHGLDARLRRQAVNGSLRDQIAAMEALVLFPDEQTKHLLARMERSSDLRLWLEALRTRTLIGDAPALAGLLEYVERPGARRAPIMEDLLFASAKQDIKGALQALALDLSPLKRALLLKVIGECREPQTLTALRRELAHEDGAVRVAAIEALGALGLDAAGPALAKATGDADWRVRLKACEAIGALGLWRHAKALAPLLDDPVWWVRLRAEEAIGRLGEPGRNVLEGKTVERAPRRRRRSQP
jgi:HEAT repeat protein